MMDQKTMNQADKAAKDAFNDPMRLDLFLGCLKASLIQVVKDKIPVNLFDDEVAGWAQMIKEIQACTTLADFYKIAEGWAGDSDEQVAEFIFEAIKHLIYLETDNA